MDTLQTTLSNFDQNDIEIERLGEIPQVYTFANHFVMEKPPAIIPNLVMSAGNKLLAMNLWKHLRLALINNKSLTEVANRYINTTKKHEEIASICRHFAHLMGVNYEACYDEFWIEHEILSQQEHLNRNTK
jgi:hypothetical protein